MIEGDSRFIGAEQQRKEGFRTALIVLGMHRSGTSALSRVLSLLGAKLPQNLMPAVENNNAKGFWESKRLQIYNDELLKHIDSRWDDWTSLDADPRCVSADLIQKGRDILRQEFQDASLLVLKDPRLCRLTPIWDRILEAEKLDARFVIPLRHPVEVADSLVARDRIQPSEGILIWLEHVLCAELHTRCRKRAFTRFDRLLKDWRGEVAEIGRELDVRWPVQECDASPEIERFLDERERHQIRHDFGEIPAPLTELAEQTWDSLCALVGNPQSSSPCSHLNKLRQSFSELRAPFEHAYRRLARELNQVQSALEHKLAKEKNPQTKAGAQSRAERREISQEYLCAPMGYPFVVEASKIARLALAALLKRRLFGDSPPLRTRMRLAKHAILLMRCKAFDAAWYSQDSGLSPGTRAEEALLHWLIIGVNKQKDPHPLFNTNWYLSEYPKVRSSGVNPLLHFLKHGWKQGKSTSPFFDPEYYLSSYADARESGMNPWLHYLFCGRNEDRSPNPFFDPKWYRRKYKLSKHLDPLKHYLLVGANQGFNPSSIFDTTWYLDTYDDVANAGVNPLRHYLEFGKAEGRLPIPPLKRSSSLTNELRTLLPGTTSISPGTANRNKPIHPKYIHGCLHRHPKKPAILLCAHAANTELYGAERSFLDILELIKELPYQAYVLLPKENKDYINALKPLSIGVICIPYRVAQKEQEPDYAAIASIMTCMVQNRISLVHVNTIVVREPLIAGRRLGLGTLIHVRESLAKDQWLSNELGKSCEAMVQDILDSTDIVIANSEQTAAEFHKPERTFIVPNTFDMGALDLSNDVNGENLYIGLISSNLPKKGIEDFAQLAKACAILHPHLRFRLIGPQNEHVRDLQRRQAAGEFGQGLEFVSYQRTPADALRKVNLVVNFSHFAESFGRTVVEAQAARRPVIVYDLGAPKTLVSEGITGYVLPVGCWEDAIPLLAAWESDRNRILEMGEAARQRVQCRFARAAGRETLQRAYDAALSSPPIPSDQTRTEGPVTPAKRPSENYGTDEISPNV